MSKLFTVRVAKGSVKVRKSFPVQKEKVHRLDKGGRYNRAAQKQNMGRQSRDDWRLFFFIYKKNVILNSFQDDDMGKRNAYF